MANGKYHKKHKRKQTFLDVLDKPPEEMSGPPKVIVPSTGTARVRLAARTDHELVDKIKSHSASLIDICQYMKGHQHTQAAELERLCTMAQARFEEAAMWAVKAATL
jgi:hypothetical protein